MKRKLYIAYGSNLDTNQMAYRCPGAKVVCKSWMHDYRLVFQGRPCGAHANVIPAKGYDVPVVIWEIDPYDEMALDRYEGVSGGYYTREFYPVEVNGQMKEALVYIMTPNPYGKPTHSYLETLIHGYHEFNFPIRILIQAVQESQQKTLAVQLNTK